MWDSLAPEEDLAPEEARDLEALLSGWAADPGRQPAAVVLAALRAAPAPGELDGEAPTLTAFRLFVLPERNWPAQQGEEASLVPEALARLDPPSVPPVTDVPPPALLPPSVPLPPPAPLPAPAPLPPPGSLTALVNGSPVNPLAPASVARGPLAMTRPLTMTGPPPGPRHRRRRGSWRGHGPAALLGAGSVAVGLVVLLCLLLIPGGGSAGREPETGNGLASASGTGAKPQLQGTGSSEPSPSKSASRSPAARPGTSTGPDSPAALCHQYVAFFGQYGSPDSRQAAMRILKQLGAHLGGQANVAAYCFSVINPGAANPWGANPGSVNPGPVNPGQWPPQPGEGQLPGGGQVDRGGFGPGFHKAGLPDGAGS